MESCLVFLIVGLLGYSIADDDTSMTEEGASVYCGRRLANTLASLCWTKDNMIKRDAGWSNENMIKLDVGWGDTNMIKPDVDWYDAKRIKPDTVWGDDYKINPHGFWSGANRIKRDAGWSNDDMVKRDIDSWSPNVGMDTRALAGSRGKRGPVDECCLKPCTVDVLLTYCD